ncbi:MAG TPA: lysylphosphatidylglycerol synthase domain-containing protein [Tepidisphaeraceae bacterium]|nr:lysylphosphatidylglycerol synthase domain-containing protein [Tepidisphaeraceae bacterium]
MKSAIKWALFIVVLIFVGWSLANQFKQIDWGALHFRPSAIALAGMCLLLVPLLQLISYRTLLGAYAHAPPMRVMMAVAWVPPLGKYVPGKIASLAGAVYLLRKFQIPAAIALSVVLAMDGLAVMSGLIVGAPLLKVFVPNGTIPAAAIIVIGIVCLHPAVFARLLNFVLRKLNRPQLDHVPDLKHYLVPVMCAFGQWVLAGFALWLITASVAEVRTESILRFISIAGLGYTISYLALFAPGGLGPRELIFQQAMQHSVVPAAMSAVAVVVMRIVQTLTELSAAGVGVMVLRRLEAEQGLTSPTSAIPDASQNVPRGLHPGSSDAPSKSA